MGGELVCWESAFGNEAAGGGDRRSERAAAALSRAGAHARPPRQAGKGRDGATSYEVRGGATAQQSTCLAVEESITGKARQKVVERVNAHW